MKRNDNASKGFVSASPPAPTLAPIAPRAPLVTPDSVMAKWRDNLGAWIGVTVLLSASYALLRIGLANANLFPLPTAEGAAWSFFVFVLIGGAAFGWLMAWRASLDERERQGELDGLREDRELMQADIDELVSKLAEYKRLYQNAQDDIAEMRRSLHASMANASQRYRQPDEEVEAEAERNAKFLLNLAYRGEKWGRDRIVQTYDNWTPTMWTEARNLLELSGIIRTVGRTTELLKPDYATAVVALAAYCHVDQSDS